MLDWWSQNFQFVAEFACALQNYLGSVLTRFMTYVRNLEIVNVIQSSWSATVLLWFFSPWEWEDGGTASAYWSAKRKIREIYRCENFGLLKCLCRWDSCSGICKEALQRPTHKDSATLPSPTFRDRDRKGKVYQNVTFFCPFVMVIVQLLNLTWQIMVAFSDAV